MAYYLTPRRVRICDKRAYALARRIRDLDVKEAIVSNMKKGGNAVAGALDWVSNKIKEKVYPEKFASEKEARLAEKQKLKDLSTVKGLLKELLRLLKAKIPGREKAAKIGNAIAEKAKKLMAFVKSHLGAILGSVAVGAIGGLLAIIFRSGKSVAESAENVPESKLSSEGKAKNKANEEYMKGASSKIEEKMKKMESLGGNK